VVQLGCGGRGGLASFPALWADPPKVRGIDTMTHLHPQAMLSVVATVGQNQPMSKDSFFEAPLYSVARSRVEMTHHVLPEFTNSLGNVFGGQIMSWIDVCAAIAAQRHCRSVVVTASIDAVEFLLPIKLGHIVILRGQVNATFNTSMECGVAVWSENPLTGEIRKAMKAYATFVALDEYAKPKPVPKLVTLDEHDERRGRDANERRAQRLANKQRSNR
jgi:acyl-CoA hydrolase